MILGLGHFANTGKDTAARILTERHGFTRVAFADAVRRVTYDTQPAIRTLVDRHGWEDAKRTYPQVRQALVAVGQSCRKHLGADCWIRAALDHADGRIVVPDVRYANEVRAIHDRGGIVVKLTRPGVEPLADECDQQLRDFDGWDVTVANDGTLDELVAKLAGVVLTAVL